MQGMPLLQLRLPASPHFIPDPSAKQCVTAPSTLSKTCSSNKDSNQLAAFAPVDLSGES